MPRKTLTPQEYAAAHGRSDRFYDALHKHGLKLYDVAAHVGKNPQTVYRWLQRGLTTDQYATLLAAVAVMATAKRGEGA